MLKDQNEQRVEFSEETVPDSDPTNQHLLEIIQYQNKYIKSQDATIARLMMKNDEIKNQLLTKIDEIEE